MPPCHPHQCFTVIRMINKEIIYIEELIVPPDAENAAEAVEVFQG